MHRQGKGLLGFTQITSIAEFKEDALLGDELYENKTYYDVFSNNYDLLLDRTEVYKRVYTIFHLIY